MLTQTARMYCGVPVFALRVPRSGRNAPPPLLHARAPRERPLQAHTAALSPRGRVSQPPHTHSDIILVRQPSHSPPSPRAVRARCAIHRSRNGQDGAHSEQWRGQVRRAPQHPNSRRAGTTRVGANPGPQRSSATVPTRRHYGVRPSSGAPIPLADAGKGPHQHTGRSFPSRPQAGRRPLGAFALEQGPHNATPAPGSRLFPDGTGSFVGARGAVLGRVFRARSQ